MDPGHYRTIAVIPARGGSKRLPGKALLDFCGRPMIAHTIEAAKDSNCFTKILVSSDCDKILEVSSNFGASTLKRQGALADDETTTAPVLLDALNIEESQGRQWDILVCLYATAPLRNAEDIRAVTRLVNPGVCDYAMAVCEADRPVHQAMMQQSNGSLAPVWSKFVGKNHGDAPRFLFGNGSAYAVFVPAFRASHTLYGPGLRGYEMPRERSVDLNTRSDFELLNFYAGVKAP